MTKNIGKPRLERPATNIYMHGTKTSHVFRAGDLMLPSGTQDTIKLAALEQSYSSMSGTFTSNVNIATSSILERYWIIE